MTRLILASWSHTWAELHFGRRRFEPFRTWSKNNFITQTMSLVGVARLHLAPAWGRCVVMYVVLVFHPLRSVKMEEHEKHGSPFSRWSFTQAFRFNVEPLNRKQHSQQGEFIVRRYCFIVYLFVFYKCSLSFAAQPFVHKQTQSLKWSFSKPLI